MSEWIKKCTNSDKGIIKKILMWRTHYTVVCVYILGCSIVLAGDAFLFHKSKASFLTGLNFSTQTLHFFEAIYVLNYFFVIVFLSISAAYLVLIPTKFFEAVIRRTTLVFASAFCALTVFVVVEKMLYSFFSRGILETHSSERAGFLAFFIFLLYFSYVWVCAQSKKLSSEANRPFRILSVAAVTLSFVVGGIIVILQIQNDPKADQQYPNIIFMSADGMRTANVSAYGYNRPTTPFLESIKEEVLFVKNAYANNSHTAGSLVSVLTGLNASTTKVFGVGNNLGPEHSRKSLPVLLEQMGYKTYSAQSTISPPLVWLEPARRNMQHAFDFPSALSRGILNVFPRVQYSLTRDLILNASVKIRHLFYLADGKKQFAAVTTPNTLASDRSIFQEALRVVRFSKQPFFLQLHLIGSHGPLFETESTLFSSGKSQYRAGQTEFYNDAIRDFDTNVRKLFEELSATGKLENTLIVIFSDHGMAHNMAETVPLFFRFPNKEHKGVFTYNVQLIDIAPTVLDYLGKEIPEWMDGESLLDPNLRSDRPIYAFTTIEAQTKEIYSLYSVHRIQCHEMVRVGFEDKSFQTIELLDDRGCPTEALYLTKSYQAVIDYLANKQFDLQSHDFQQFAGYLEKSDPIETK